MGVLNFFLCVYDYCLRSSKQYFSYIQDEYKFNNIFYMFICLMVFNVIFNNISVTSWRSVLLLEETGGTRENHRPVTSR